MSKSRTLFGTLLVVATGAILAGCADDPPSTQPQADPYPSMSSPATTTPATTEPARSSPTQESATSPSAKTPAALPTLARPTAPPRGPTDQIKKTNLVVGTVTRGGSGPCYGLATDDGTAYALHATTAHQLVKGTRVRVQTKPSLLRIDCGTGKLVEIVTVEPLR
jgi:hypothetical protein